MIESVPPSGSALRNTLDGEAQQPAAGSIHPSFAPQPPDARTVFLSYASEDLAPAARICKALRDAGIDVWFDQNELRGGDAWDASIRRKIRECALFIPVVSANTEARQEAYFRLEWKLGVDRSFLMAEDRPFLMPVVIDGTREATAHVPHRFNEVQWTRLPGGETPAAFVARIQQLLADSGTAAPATSLPMPDPRGKSAPLLPRRPPYSAKGARRRWQAAAVVLLVALVGVGAWQGSRLLRALEPPPPAAFSVAVLPFVPASAEATRAEFARTFTDELLTRLGESKMLKLASAGKVREFDGSNLDTRSLGQGLDVRYLVTGEVRSAGSASAITAHLVDARSGTNLWSGQATSNAQAASQDDSAAQVLGHQLRKAIFDAEVSRAAANPVPGSSVDLYLQGIAAMQRSTTEDERRASRKYFDAALRIDPNNFAALSTLWELLHDERLDGGDLDPAARAALEHEMFDLSSRMIGIDENSAATWSHRAETLVLMGLPEQALQASDRQLSIDPNDADGYATRAWILLTLDRPEDALAAAQRGAALPTDNYSGSGAFAIRMVGESEMLMGRYAEGVTAYEKAASISNGAWDRIWLVAGYTRLGESDKAAKAKAALFALKPHFTIATLEGRTVRLTGFRKRMEVYLFAPLREAGIPDH